MLKNQHHSQSKADLASALCSHSVSILQSKSLEGSAVCKMASGHIARARPEESENILLKIAGKAAEDLKSQVGRLGPNLHLARSFGQATLSNGVVDDRKYLVSMTGFDLMLAPGSNMLAVRGHHPVGGVASERLWPTQ